MLYEIVSILDSVLGISKQFSHGEYYYFCPFCHHYKPKLAVNVVKRKWQCWKCGARGGRLLSLLRKLNVSREQQSRLQTLLMDEIPHVKTDEVEASLVLPPEFTPLWVPDTSREYKQALSYLKGRGVTAFDILSHNIGYCSEGLYKGRIVIPSYDASGALNFFVGRSYWKNVAYPHMNPHISRNIIGFENHINWNYPVFLVEGAFDAMAVKRNVIPLFGKTIPKKLQQKIIEVNAKEIYLVFDRDALKDSLKYAEKFMNQGVAVYLVEMNGKDPSELGFVETQHLLRETKPLTFQDLIHLRLSLAP